MRVVAVHTAEETWIRHVPSEFDTRLPMAFLPQVARPRALAMFGTIGSRTGVSDLGSIRLGPAETFTAGGVPPGRYFVRLHTVNHTGESAAAAELVVDGP